MKILTFSRDLQHKWTLTLHIRWKCTRNRQWQGVLDHTLTYRLRSYSFYHHILSLFSFYFALLLNQVHFCTDMRRNCQVIEVAPAHCVVQVSKSVGDLRMYNEVRKHILLIKYSQDRKYGYWFNFDYQFCESLSNLLKDESSIPPHGQDSVDRCETGSIEKQDAEW